MEQLSTEDAARIIHLLQSCSPGTGDEESSVRFFNETLKAFDADELVFLYPNPNTDGIDLHRSFSLGRDRSFLTRYADYFWRYDPLFNVQLGENQTPRAFRTEDVLPFDHFYKLQYYYDFLQPQNLRCELVIRLWFKSCFLGAISLLRSQDRPFFSRDDVQKAEILIPYIVDRIDAGEIAAPGWAEQRLLEQWLESQCEGIILLDSDFRILYSNSQAKSICRQLNRTPGPISALQFNCNIPMPEIIIRDCRLLARAGPSGEPAYRYDNRIVNLSAQQRFHLQYFTYNYVNPKAAGYGYIIILNDLSRYNDDETIVNGQTKLSHREAVVARFAGLGWTNKEIAASIHSSPFTIQNQLKKVFEKTGLKNRTQLANLMKYADNLRGSP